MDKFSRDKLIRIYYKIASGNYDRSDKYRYAYDIINYAEGISCYSHSLNSDDDSLSVFSSEIDIIDEKERFNLDYEILDKRQDDLNKDENNIFKLEKNTRNIK